MTSQRTVAKKTMQIANHDNKKKLGRREKIQNFHYRYFALSPLPPPFFIDLFKGICFTD